MKHCSAPDMNVQYKQQILSLSMDKHWSAPPELQTKGQLPPRVQGGDKRATASIPAPQQKVLLLNVYDNLLKQG